MTSNNTVFLHIGQCGNQIGEMFWERVQRHAIAHGGSPFLDEDGKAPAILIDTEPKASC
jgi:hypothetical protein